ncbi:hypothetical protein OAG68_01790 [bacterium]|nr:hypothetical protein [bacterium]
MPKLRRIVDLTTPNKPVPENVRMDQRNNRCIAVAIADWDKRKGPMTDHVGLGFTCDLSDWGIGVITQYTPKTPENVLAFFLPGEMESPWYFHGFITNYQREPNGFIKLGYNIVEFLDASKCQNMNSIAAELLTVSP